MGNLFRVDGKFYTASAKILDMILLALMWVVGCLPVVTILTSTASLYHTAVKCVRYERGKALEEFVSAYKKNLKQGVGLTVLYGAVGTGIYFFLRFLMAGVMTGYARLFLLTIGMLVVLLYAMNLQWLIPLFSRLDMSMGALLQLNYKITVRYFLRGLLLVLLLAGVAFVCGYLPVGLVILPPLGMVWASHVAEPVLLKCMPKSADAESDWRYGG
ncbi:MAG: YesL family protein [Lachnospiraceae bacterium]|nr:YesL family protein [Lachnospiraceae bacterium]